MNKSLESYGGFLPLEISKNKKYSKGYYGKYKNIISYNTIKAAIPYIAKKISAEKIYAPEYLCPNVLETLRENFKEVILFHIGKDLLPDIDFPERSVIYIVDYFGIMENTVKKYIKKHPSCIFLLDNAHSFFSAPIISDSVFNLYSCKKFFGVPDGGYLIAKSIEAQKDENSYSSDYSSYLIESLEHGTNYCYEKKKKADSIINENFGGISVLAEKLLSSVDYDSVKKIRKANFKAYDKTFGKINKIKCEPDSVPYVYPLNVGKNIKTELIAKKIFVPTLWLQVLTEKNKASKTFEYDMAENTIFLPLDQRYNCMGEGGINHVIDTVTELLEQK